MVLNSEQLKQVSAQNAYSEASGAFTGEISAEQIKVPMSHEHLLCFT